MTADPRGDRCPRCGGMFSCGAGGAAPCACTAIPLDAGLQRALRESFNGCLCLRCLAGLAVGEPIDRTAALPAP